MSHSRGPLVRAARWALRRAGLDIVRIARVNSIQARRSYLVGNAGVHLILDVGANTGQYGRELRESGFGGTIVSYEPGPDAFRLLQRVAERDPHWICRHIALGDAAGTAELHVAPRSAASSLLPATELLAAVMPDAAANQVETVSVMRLDDAVRGLASPEDRILLKLDVQGSELAVLRGAREFLAQVVGVEAELSLVPLYVGQPLFEHVVAFLDMHSFDLVALEPAFRDPKTGKLLQLDGFFERRHST